MGPEPSPGRPLSVLLAEDNPVNARVATIVLESAGHRVFPVRDGRRAIAALAQEAFDIVLMDLQMPDMDGFEAIRIVRRDEASTGAHVPIVALTAQALRGDRELCLEAGADAYLAKPFVANDLLLTIEAALAAAVRPAGSPARDPKFATDADEERTGTPALAFHPSALLEPLGGDEEVARQIIAVFFENITQMRADLDASLRDGDAQAIEAAAHKLKGMLLAMGGRPAAASAERLQRASRGALLDAARDEGRVLGRELDRFGAALARWADAPPAYDKVS